MSLHCLKMREVLICEPKRKKNYCVYVYKKNETNGFQVIQYAF